MRGITHRKTIAIILAVLFVFIGCASTPPSRFYTLNSLKAAEPAKNLLSKKLSLALGPVEIPDYLDRQQIAVRTSQNEIVLSEFDRWAGSLRDNVADVLSENLSMLMGRDQVSIVPWVWGVAYDYRISVNVVKFDIMPDGNVVLDADWTLLTKDGRRLTTRRDSVTEPIRKQTYESRVSAMSGALAVLSRNIADELNSVLRKPLSGGQSN